LLDAGQQPVATDGNAGFPRHAAGEPGLDGLAIVRATVAADRVSIVTRFVRREIAIAADGLVDAGLARLRTYVIRFDLANATATIAALAVAIVALLVSANYAIATVGAGRSVVGGVRRVHDDHHASNAAASAARAAARDGSPARAAGTITVDGRAGAGTCEGAKHGDSERARRRHEL
jgi:hypothetical protein